MGFKQEMLALQNCMKYEGPTSFLKVSLLEMEAKRVWCTEINQKKHLWLMRDKCWEFIGDLISGNHVQLFLCILWIELSWNEMKI